MGETEIDIAQRCPVERPHTDVRAGLMRSRNAQQNGFTVCPKTNSALLRMAIKMERHLC